MPDVTAHSMVKALEIRQVVVRCGCSAEEKQSADFHGYRGVPCHQPRAMQDNGVVVRWHRNPLRRALFAMRRIFTGKV